MLGALNIFIKEVKLPLNLNLIAALKFIVKDLYFSPLHRWFGFHICSFKWKEKEKQDIFKIKVILNRR